MSIWLGSGLPLCPDVEAPPLIPAVVAEQVVRTIQLPVPDPYIAPGEMLVGMRAYLEAGPGLDFTHREDTPLGPIDIAATAHTVVDWGDGTVTEHDSVGGPYPDGDVTHVWQHDGAYDVVVTYAWSVEWAIGGATGTIDTGLATTGTIDDFPVQERQAVITDIGR